jgi:8-oxo-dGTP pyrophosphatase MutT (NUDIX family)
MRYHGREGVGVVKGVDPYPWRDAATVIPWVRRPGGGRLVLMIERPVRQPGWPGFWVFPGGGVSLGDRGAPEPFAGRSDGDLTRWMAAAERSARGIAQERFMTWAAPKLAARLGYVPTDRWPSWDRDPQANRASWHTATRELFEETGLLVAEGIRLPAVSRASRELAFRSLPSRPAALRYHGRLATPPHERLRFDARFFSVDATAAPWPAATPAIREVERLMWVEPARALASDRLALPTRYVLERLDDLLDAADAAEPGWTGHIVRKVED